jgi:hypothetical protein
MNKSPESWAKVSVDAVFAGSAEQARNVLAMALQDIAALAAELDKIKLEHYEECGGGPRFDAQRWPRGFPST